MRICHFEKNEWRITVFPFWNLLNIILSKEDFDNSLEKNDKNVLKKQITAKKIVQNQINVVENS